MQVLAVAGTMLSWSRARECGLNHLMDPEFMPLRASLNA